MSYLQVVTFLHTMLLSEKIEFTTALIVCPLNTVLNWINEFSKWQEGLDDDECLEVFIYLSLALSFHLVIFRSLILLLLI